MSLFDVIKYSATDLTSYEELTSLPALLIQLYWKEQGWSDLHDKTDKEFETKCHYLSRYARLSKPNRLNFYKRNYKTALINYSKFIDRD